MNSIKKTARNASRSRRGFACARGVVVGLAVLAIPIFDPRDILYIMMEADKYLLAMGKSLLIGTSL